MSRLKWVVAISELGAHDQSCIALSGSRGGFSFGEYTLAVRPLFGVFKDVGGGWLATIELTKA